eukprot:8652681-Ditylum_brightwellii.AAC.1
MNFDEVNIIDGKTWQQMAHQQIQELAPMGHPNQGLKVNNAFLGYWASVLGYPKSKRDMLSTRKRQYLLGWY